MLKWHTFIPICYEVFLEYLHRIVAGYLPNALFAQGRLFYIFIIYLFIYLFIFKFYIFKWAFLH